MATMHLGPWPWQENENTKAKLAIWREFELSHKEQGRLLTWLIGHWQKRPA
jgi:hypothetical protein